MISVQLVRQLFPATRTIPWSHYYELTDFEYVLATYLINGAPRSQESVNLLNNTSALIGLGKGFGIPKASTLPIEWLYLWSVTQACQRVNLNEARAEEWGIIYPAPTCIAELSEYMMKVYDLKHQQIQALDDIRGFITTWREEVRLAYAYAQFGRVAMEPDTDLGNYTVAPKDRKRVLGALHQAWEGAKMEWKPIIAERAEAVAIKRSPIKRVNDARRTQAAAAREAKRRLGKEIKR